MVGTQLRKDQQRYHNKEHHGDQSHGPDHNLQKFIDRGTNHLVHPPLGLVLGLEHSPPNILKFQPLKVGKTGIGGAVLDSGVNLSKHGCEDVELEPEVLTHILPISVNDGFSQLIEPIPNLEGREIHIDQIQQQENFEGPLILLPDRMAIALGLLVIGLVVVIAQNSFQPVIFFGADMGQVNEGDQRNQDPEGQGEVHLPYEGVSAGFSYVVALADFFEADD